MSRDYRFKDDMIEIKFDQNSYFKLYFKSYKAIVKFMAKQALPYCMNASQVIYKDHHRYMKEVARVCYQMYNETINYKSCKHFVKDLAKLCELFIISEPSRQDDNEQPK